MYEKKIKMTYNLEQSIYMFRAQKFCQSSQEDFFFVALCFLTLG